MSGLNSVFPLWWRLYAKSAIPMLIILLLLVSIAQESYAQKKKASNTLLWEISGNGLAKSSYLFGTYHFADKGFIDTMKTVNEKLQATEIVVGELVMDSTLAFKLMPYMMMKDTTLAQLLTEKEYQLVAGYIKKLGGGDLKFYNTMKPVVLQTFILQATSPVTFTNTNPQIDQYFQDYARMHKKRVIGLETVEEQALILFGSTLARQKELLLKSIKNAMKNKADVDKLYRNYITQNLSELEKSFIENSEFTKEEMDNLLKNRNEKWLLQLPALMQEQPLFIVVGLGHFLGKNGLIKRLQALGYTVSPLATH